MSLPDDFLARLMERRIRPDVLAMQAYPVQDATGLVKLDLMENPYRLSEDLQAQLGQRLGAVALNRYPGERVQALRRALAAHADMPAGYDLVLGNGSDELISMLAMVCSHTHAVAGGQRPVVLAPVPGFVMYAMSAQLQGLQFQGVPLTPDFALDVPAMQTAIRDTMPALVYLAYPNNPTTNLWSVQSMLAVVQAAADAGSLVVVDEAYQPFSSHTFMEVLRQSPASFPHVLLMRTLSKFGLAGVRIGYLVGAAPLIAHVDKVRPPFNVSALNAECALFALEHAQVFAQQAEAIRSERARLMQAFGSFASLQAWPSEANMILVRCAGQEDAASRVFSGLKARGILIKNVSAMHPLLRNCVRITVGTAVENDALLAALKEVV